MFEPYSPPPPRGHVSLEMAVLVSVLRDVASSQLPEAGTLEVELEPLPSILRGRSVAVKVEGKPETLRPPVERVYNRFCPERRILSYVRASMRASIALQAKAYVKIVRGELAAEELVRLPPTSPVPKISASMALLGKTHIEFGRRVIRGEMTTHETVGLEIDARRGLQVHQPDGGRGRTRPKLVARIGVSVARRAIG